MKAYPTSEIRNVALIGHGDCGKTSLCAAMLHTAGAVKRLGKVDDGTTVTDFDDEEIERKISLQTSTAHLEWKGKKVNLLDTPGYTAFVADAQSAMAVCDGALLLVDGVSGIEVVTRRAFRYAEAAKVALAFVVSRLDRENSSFDRTLAAIQERFGRAAVPIQLPIGSETGFDGVVDLISMKALRYERDGSGKHKEEAIPGDLEEAAKTARAALVEMIAESDDSLMETFFESGDLTDEQLAGGLRKAVRERSIFPVLASAALHQVGTQGVLDRVAELMPAPGERGDAVGFKPVDAGDAGVAERAEETRKFDVGEPLSLFVFKTVADPFAGRLSFFQVRSGKLTGDSSAVNVRSGNSERLGAASLAQGKQLEAIDEIHAGDLGVVAKLKDTHTNDTLADPSAPIQYPAIDFPAPSISFAVEPKSKGDEEKLGSTLQRITEEDPVLKVGRDPKTNELLVSGSGQVHVEVAIAKMRKKFGVDAILKQPKVPYLETIKRKVGPTQGRHKKQSGGRGQFGDCVIEMEPLPRGGGFEFVDKIFGGSIPQNFRPAVEKGIREAADRGWLSGNPVVDFRVTLVDGSYHTVDSSEIAFKIAGSLAFKQAMEKASPTLLEPVMSVEITAPEEYMGDIMGDLSSRRGKPQGMDAEGDYQVIRAQVPMVEMLSYASTLKAITSDRATYHMEFDHYEEAPAQVREQIIAEAAREKEKAGHS
jgi:elongation factor G